MVRTPLPPYPLPRQLAMQPGYKSGCRLLLPNRWKAALDSSGQLANGQGRRACRGRVAGQHAFSLVEVCQLVSCWDKRCSCREREGKKESKRARKSCRQRSKRCRLKFHWKCSWKCEIIPSALTWDVARQNTWILTQKFATLPPLPLPLSQ